MTKPYTIIRRSLLELVGIISLDRLLINLLFAYFVLVKYNLKLRKYYNIKKKNVTTKKWFQHCGMFRDPQKPKSIY